MPAPLLLHPFRVRVSGRVAVAEQGTDDYVDSQIAVAIGTVLGEREMAWSYGVASAEGLTLGDVQTVLDDFGPDGVSITSVTVTQVSDDTETVHVEWAGT